MMARYPSDLRVAPPGPGHSSYKAGARSQIARRLCHLLGREPKLLHHHIAVRRRAKLSHADAHAVVGRVATPAQRRQRLHRHALAARLRQHRLLVLFRLLVVQLHARHGHHARVVPLVAQRLCRNGAQRHLASRADEDVAGRAVRVLHDVAALKDTLRLAARQLRHALPRERQQRGALRAAQHDAVCAGRLAAAAGANYRHVGHRAEARELLDRLVRGAVAAEADAVVRGDVRDAVLAQRAEPHARAHVVCKDGERARERDDAGRVRGQTCTHGGRRRRRSRASGAGSMVLRTRSGARCTHANRVCNMSSASSSQRFNDE